MTSELGSPWRRWLGRLAALTAGVLGARYLLWRAGTLESTGALGGVFYAAELTTYLSLLLTGAILWRAHTCRRPLRRPVHGTVDVLVTVCGEPSEMLDRTLRAAVAVRGRHETYVLNDSRLAQADNWAAVEAVAARHGVKCLTRTSGTRSKAANLNHGLGHTAGQFVVTIDADHVADPGLLEEILGYFADPRVGFVATRQRFRRAGSDVLNNAEPMFYGALQWAKAVDGSAFSCGNGTAYRRAALTEIGGFSEWNVVEDLHTSYLLHARGWLSVYHGSAVTTGTAPLTAATYLTQRRRWAMDSLRLLVWDSPLLRSGLTPGQRLHYLHTSTSYLFALPQLVFALGPGLSVLAGVQLMRVASTGTYLHQAVPYLGSVLAFLGVYAGPMGAIRTVQGSLFTAPTYLFAALRALHPRRPVSGTTQKVGERRLAKIVLPAFALALLQAATLATLIARGEGNGSPVAAVWAAVMLGLLLGPLSSTIGGLRHRRTARLTLRFAAAAGTAVALLVGQTSLGHPTKSLAESATASAAADVVSGGATAGAVAPARQKLLPPPAGSYFGASSADLPPGGSLATFGRRNGRPQVVMWFQQWGSGETRFRADWVDRVAAQGAIPMITWEPWSKPKDRYAAADQPAARLALIASGRYDRYVTAWARAAAAHRAPLVIRFMHEMNGNWYPWSVTTNGNSAALFVRAWRHVHDLFRAAGATNVSWVWSLNTLSGLSVDGPPASSYYPGDRYVDWVGVSGMNWGDSASWSRWASARSVFDSTLRLLAPFHKPIMISEVATVTTGGDPVNWTRDFQKYLLHPAAPVRAVVWFDHNYTPGVRFRFAPGVSRLLLTASTTAQYAARLRVTHPPRDIGRRPPLQP